MYKIYIFISIILLLGGYIYYDSLPQKELYKEYGYALKLFKNAKKGDLVILKEKNKIRTVVTAFRVVDSSANKGLHVQYTKKTNNLWSFSLFENSLDERMGKGSDVIKKFVHNSNLFILDTFYISKAEMENLMEKYYLSTYGPLVKKEPQKPTKFPTNIWYIFMFTAGIILTRWFNGYIKTEIVIDRNIIIYIVLIVTAGFFASKHSEELLFSFGFNLFFIKNLIIFFAIYFILGKIKKKYLGLESDEYVLISLTVILGVGCFGEYFGGKLIATIQIVKTGLVRSLFLNHYQTITLKGYLISPFIFVSWWFYFGAAYFISHLFELVLFTKNDKF